MSNKVEISLVSIIQDIINNLYPGALSLEFLDMPKDARYGDYSTNIALRISKVKKCPPQDIAAAILAEINKKIENSVFLKERIDRVELKQGFINFFLAKIAYQDTLNEIARFKHNFGRITLGKGKKIHLEFVSANPTGALSLAHGRQAAVGDILSNILKFSGYRVYKEYYLNDEGNQIRLLGESLYIRYLELYGKTHTFPEQGYRGQYMIDMAEELKNKYGDKFLNIDKEKLAGFFSRYAVDKILKHIKNDLNEFGVKFDNWASQAKIAGKNEINKALHLLKLKKMVYEQDNALWLKSTQFGDDKDRVLVKSDGSFTYIAPDIAYHRRKFSARYDLVINIWGPDHHGYISRLKAAIEALGYDKEKLHIIIIQLSTLYRGNAVIPMSTRAGEYITLEEVRKEVGIDATRFFFVMRKCDSHLDFDLELAKQKSLENPVYYIQYAYARICSIFEFKNKISFDLKNIDLSKLDNPEERQIIKTLGAFPKVIGDCAHHLEPFHLTVYLREVAGLFHSYYNKYRIITDDVKISSARLFLVDCTRQVLQNGLNLLGVNAPKKM